MPVPLLSTRPPRRAEESSPGRDEEMPEHAPTAGGVLGRETSSAPLLREIDGLRVLALVFVIGLHYMHRLCIIAPERLIPNPDPTLLMAMMQKGDFGVQIFFTISGFVLSLPFARQFLKEGRKIGTGRFYLRRLVRLQGPLLINLMVHVLVLGVVLHKYALPVLMAQFLPSLGWWVSTTGQLSLINPVTWSLETELQFCLLMPLICRLFSIKSMGLRRGLMVLAIIVPPFFKGLFHPVWLPAQIEYFMVGLLLADCHLVSWSHASAGGRHLWTWAGGISFIGMLVALAVRHDHSLLVDEAMPVIGFLGIGGVLNSPVWKHLFAHRWLAVVGGWCYTVYLYHILIIYGVLTLLFKVVPLKGLYAAFWGYLPVCLLAILGSCALLYLFTERPFIHLSARLAKKGRSGSSS
ncbi:MAG: hypothetical protein JWO94_2740 [Verrucomicrobiaceae bacterium]|nr:hypothetical protein [Verrucomicrobiaceae bacterium]